jgi:aminomethyltransferase
MAPFAGWDMPISYRSILEEHRAVRAHAGLFDVSHMGVVEIRGSDAAATCQRLTTNDIRRLADGQAQYSLLCNDRGGVLDDVIVYRLAAERYMLCVNAANTAADVAWMREHRLGNAELVDLSEDSALLALQGPRAVDVLAPHTDSPIGTLPSFGCVETRIAGASGIIARTGYTGGDGFELFVGATSAEALWDRLLEGSGGVVPTGLGARDTLRLEAGLLLHGTDMDETTTALEAGLGWVVKLDAGPFIGSEALAAESGAEPTRRLVGLVLDQAGIPRHGYPILLGQRRIGTITSGTLSPMLQKGIGLGFVANPHQAVGTRVAVSIRGRAVEARVARRPFYSATQR